MSDAGGLRVSNLCRTRIGRVDEEHGVMRRALFSLETKLLRRAVQRLTDGREDCVDCERTPLVGELVHIYADDTIVCSLCRAAHAGEPERSKLVLHSELGHTVKPAARIAA